MKITDLPKSDMPCEELFAKGAEYLKDSELLAILLWTGKAGKNVVEIASQILSKYSKKRLLQMTYQDWVKISGIDSAKATAPLAAFALSKHAFEVNDTNFSTIFYSERYGCSTDRSALTQKGVCYRFLSQCKKRDGSPRNDFTGNSKRESGSSSGGL